MLEIFSECSAAPPEQEIGDGARREHGDTLPHFPAPPDACVRALLQVTANKDEKRGNGGPCHGHADELHNLWRFAGHKLLIPPIRPLRFGMNLAPVRSAGRWHIQMLSASAGEASRALRVAGASVLVGADEVGDTVCVLEGHGSVPGDGQNRHLQVVVGNNKHL